MKSLQVSGLDHVIFAETELSLVDGEAGRLILRGFEMEQLSGRLSFSEMLHLLWFGHEPTAEEAALMAQRLGAARVAVYPRIAALPDGPEQGMDFLRFALASFEENDSDALNASLTLIAAVAVAACVWIRRKQGLAPMPPRAALGHGADILRMIQNKEAEPHQAAALEAYLVTVMDHGMNASTFTARVVASTGSDLVSAVVAAIGALKGPLHGGAPGPVLEMLAAIERPEQARAWLESELLAGRRIMGMGHRIYRVRDPRAAVLEQAIERLEKAGAQSLRLQLARAVEKAAAQLLAEKYPDRPLKANVEFYTAVLLDALDLPAEFFSSCFAMGRVVGWCAHVAEQRKYGRLVRPQSQYVGPMPRT